MKVGLVFTWVSVLFLTISIVRADSSYSFESLNNGQQLVGQDGWKFLTSPFPEQASPVVSLGPGTDTTTVAALGARAGVAQVIRSNDANFSFKQFNGTETAAIEQFDAYVGTTGGSGNFTSMFGAGHGTTLGPWFGLNGSASGGFFDVIGADGIEHHSSSIPSDVHVGDWVRFSLTMNFTANGGAGSGTLSYQDLTASATRLDVTGLQNVNLGLSALDASASPGNWDTMFLRLDNGSNALMAADNLSVNATPLPSSASAGLVLLVGLKEELKRDAIGYSGIDVPTGGVLECRKDQTDSYARAFTA